MANFWVKDAVRSAGLLLSHPAGLTAPAKLQNSTTTPDTNIVVSTTDFMDNPVPLVSQKVIIGDPNQGNNYITLSSDGSNNALLVNGQPVGGGGGSMTLISTQTFNSSYGSQNYTATIPNTYKNLTIKLFNIGFEFSPGVSAGSGLNLLIIDGYPCTLR